MIYLSLLLIKGLVGAETPGIKGKSELGKRFGFLGSKDKLPFLKHKQKFKQRSVLLE